MFNLRAGWQKAIVMAMKIGQEITLFREIPTPQDVTGIMREKLYGSINTALKHNTPVFQIAGHFVPQEVM